ncbi:galactonate dehydratase protein [Lentinula aff. detonsa]|nr:galactonate dehydratase protein [Lentinula aff. detonsa]
MCSRTTYSLDLPDSMLELIFMGRLHRGMAKQLAKLLEPLRPMFIEGPYLERRAIDIAQPDVSHCGEISELHRIASYAETHDVALAPHCPLGPIALAVFVIQEMSWKMHYNVAAGVALGIEADLHSYMANPEVFTVKDGYVAVRQGMNFGSVHSSVNVLWRVGVVATSSLSSRIDARPGIGVEIDEGRVRKASELYMKHTPRRNPLWRGEDGSLKEWACGENLAAAEKLLVPAHHSRVRELREVV